MKIIKGKEETKTEIITISFSKEEILKYFKKCATPTEIKECIVKWALMHIST